MASLPDRLDETDALHTAVVIGSGLGGTGTLIEQISVNATRGPDRVSPVLHPHGHRQHGGGAGRHLLQCQGAQLLDHERLRERRACHRRGRRDHPSGRRRGGWAGGAEATVYEATLGGFAAMRALSTRNDDPAGASRPFDSGRDGFVLAEGAGMIVLEELGHARARGARILAELCGYAASADASHITTPAPGGEGALRAARRALQKAGIGIDEIDVGPRTPRAPPRATWRSWRPSARCSASAPRGSL